MAVMIAVIACRKMDRQHPVSKNELEQKFFYSRVSSDRMVSAVTGFVFRQNQKYNFLKDLTNRIGFPYWNKALIFSGPLEYGRGNTDSADIVYIPFVRESENFVNAALIVKLTQTDTAFKILYDWKYRDYGFEPGNREQWNARNIFHIFAKLDYSVFGRRQFQIIDERLLSEEDREMLATAGISFDSVLVIYTLKNQSQGSDRPAVMVPVESCEFFTTCVAYLPCYQEIFYPYVRPVSLGAPCCVLWGTWQLCTTIWLYDGGGGGGGSGEPGGGGGFPPPGGWGGEPCPGGSGRYLVINPCGGGWIPLPDEPVNPCDAYITALQEDTAFVTRFSALNSSSVTNLTYEKGYFVANRATRNYVEMQGNPNQPYISLYFTLPMEGYIHSHYSGLNSIFSAGDVYLMAKTFLDGKAKDSANLFFGVTSNYGSPYLMKVTNTAQFRAFAEKIVAMEKDAKKSKRFTHKYDWQAATSDPSTNEREFLKMLHKEGAGSGLTLYRGNNGCNQWTKLSLSGNTVTGQNCF